MGSTLRHAIIEDDLVLPLLFFLSSLLPTALHSCMRKREKIGFKNAP